MLSKIRFINLVLCFILLELDKKKPFYIFGSGLLAGGLASCITQPFDVIKTSQQLSKDNILFVDAIILIKQVHNMIIVFT